MASPDTGISQRLMNWARGKSPWITVYNSGACNACDIEIIACLMPRFDVERFGILVKGSPRHADILIVTGPVTLKQAPRLRRVWEQTVADQSKLPLPNTAGGWLQDVAVTSRLRSPLLHP